jgi:hypothetical protein
VRCRRGRRLAETRAMSCGDAGGGLRVCPGTVHRSPPARAGGTAGYPPPRLPHRLASGAGTAHAAPGRGSAFGARAGFGRGCNAGFPRAGIRCLGTRIGRVGGEGVCGYRGRESPTARRPHRLAPVGFYCVNTHTHTHTHAHPEYGFTRGEPVPWSQHRANGGQDVQSERPARWHRPSRASLGETSAGSDAIIG